MMYKPIVVMSKYHRFVRPAPAFESAPEGGRVVSGGGRRGGARLRGGSSLQVMSDAIERAVQNGKGGRTQRGRGKAPRPSMRGGNELVIQRKHVGFGSRKKPQGGCGRPLRGGSKLLMKGAGMPARERGSMMRGGGDGGGAPPMSVADGGTPSTEADISSSGGSGALGVGANMMQMQQINPRPQRYGGVRVSPMRLMVDKIPVIGQ